MVLAQASLERAFPSAFKNPFLQALLPVGPRCIDPLGDLKCVRIEFKGRNAAELVTVGIVEFVIVNDIFLAEDPFAARSLISLRRLSLDEVSQCLDPRVGM